MDNELARRSRREAESVGESLVCRLLARTLVLLTDAVHCKNHPVPVRGCINLHACDDASCMAGKNYGGFSHQSPLSGARACDGRRVTLTRTRARGAE